MDISDKVGFHYRVPVDGEYATLIGVAVWTFSYLEKSLVDICRYLDVSFGSTYYRGTRGITAGQLSDKFLEIISRSDQVLLASVNMHTTQLHTIQAEFGKLTQVRNGLLHAHCITAQDDSQILGYQTGTSRAVPFHDFIWTPDEVKQFIEAVHSLVTQASEVTTAFSRVKAPFN